MVTCGACPHCESRLVRHPDTGRVKGHGHVCKVDGRPLTRKRMHMPACMWVFKAASPSETGERKGGSHDAE
jgi:hypothetical protein